jgi:hypothetical protein
MNVKYFKINCQNLNIDLHYAHNVNILFSIVSFDDR